MNKREFLAVGGAVPLMLAGCGGGTGNAPVRLINASVGYPLVGFMVNTTQATSSDVAYGSASPFETVSAGSVTTSLTVSSGGSEVTVSTSTRTLSKSSSYDLIAYGFNNELKSVLVTESTVAPNTGYANVNVLNTSVDIGAVDVYVSPGTNLSLGTQIASSVGGVTQSLFTGVLAGTYYFTVVGAGSVARGVTDVRFQTPVAITLVDQQIMTIILTPGASGTLANAILLTQGTGTNSGTVSYTNTTARVRAISAVQTANTTIEVTAKVGGVVTDVLPLASAPNASQYIVVDSTSSPVVLVNGVATTTPGTLAAGADYTLLVYPDATNPANVDTQLLLDDNTAPILPTGVKFRLINLASAISGEVLTMTVNSSTVASNIGYAKASAYDEVAVPQTTASTVQVTNGLNIIWTLAPSQVLEAGKIFTEILVDPSNPTNAGFFLDSTIL